MPSFIDNLLSFPSDLPTAQHWGVFGDYIGGVYGTVLSIITFILVIITWITTRRSELKYSLLSVLAEMLKTHDLIVQSNPDMARKFLVEISKIYKISERLIPDSICIYDRVDMAYTFSYYGLNIQATEDLSRMGDENVKRLRDEVARLRDRALRSVGGAERYKGLFNGRQEEMSHYMRNLFSMYSLIDQARISNKDKVQFGKIIRSKLSNYDQAVLALNVISHLGQEWEARGLLEGYKPFANVPERFFGFAAGLSLKERFPSVEFEWEHSNGKRSWYKTVRLFSFAVTLARHK